MTTITRQFRIDAGHRLLRHEGKCAHVHGHSYTIELTVSAEALDDVGRVIDFGVLEQVVGGWLQDTFDHGFIAEQGDPIIEFFEKTPQKLVVLDVPPSVENLSQIFFAGAARLLEEHKITVKAVRAYETPKSWADFTGPVPE